MEFSSHASESKRILDPRFALPLLIAGALFLIVGICLLGRVGSVSAYFGKPVEGRGLCRRHPVHRPRGPCYRDWTGLACPRNPGDPGTVLSSQQPRTREASAE